MAHQPGFFQRIAQVVGIRHNHQLSGPHQLTAQVADQHIKMVRTLQADARVHQAGFQAVVVGRAVVDIALRHASHP